MTNEVLEKLLDDVDTWFYNYFTTDNFETTDEVIDALYKAKGMCSSVLADCYDSLRCDYGWDSKCIDESYDLVMDKVYEDAIWKLNRYGIAC